MMGNFLVCWSCGTSFSRKRKGSIGVMMMMKEGRGFQFQVRDGRVFGLGKKG